MKLVRDSLVIKAERLTMTTDEPQLDHVGGFIATVRVPLHQHDVSG
jgi:hypothetical protein